MNLTWQDNSTTETGFIIEDADSAEGPWQQIGTAATNAEHYTVLGLALAHAYYFRVTAVNPAPSLPSDAAEGSLHQGQTSGSLINTGADANGNLLADGASDHFYETSHVVDTDRYPFGPWENTATAKWVAGEADESSGEPDGEYSYDYRFNLGSSVDLSHLVISGEWAVDNSSPKGIYINGHATGNTIPEYTGFTPMHSFNISSYIQAGDNVLTFYVENGPAGVPSPEGLIVDDLRIDSTVPTVNITANDPSAAVNSDGTVDAGQYTISRSDGTVDSGKLIHFYDPGTYTITVESSEGKDIETFDADVTHTSNDFDDHAAPPDTSGQDSEIQSEPYIPDSDDSSSQSNISGDSNTSDSDGPDINRPDADTDSPPPLIIKQNIPLSAVEETEVVVQEVIYAHAYANSKGGVLIGLANMTTDVKPRRTVVINNATFTIIPTSEQRFYIPVSNAKTDDGTYIVSGGYKAANDAMTAWANWAKCKLIDDGAGTLSLTLPDDTALSLKKDGDYGYLDVKRVGEPEFKILFADAFKNIVVSTAAKDITDIDRLDGPAYDTLIEEKDGLGLLKADPIELPANLQAWVAKNITKKLTDYISISTTATSLRKGNTVIAPYTGPNELPSLNYIQSLRHIRMELSANAKAGSGFENAVSDAVQAILQANPGWTVDIVYK